MVSWTSLHASLLGLVAGPSVLSGPKTSTQLTLGDTSGGSGLTSQKVTLNDVEFEQVSSPAFPDYHLRFTEPNLCNEDSVVIQYSGYLDTAHGKHLFFWFVESRDSPITEPLTLWLNGGPGCSSSTGLLWEIGPCRINPGGNGTSFNEFSWTSHSNVLFLDQPDEVGFSYADNGLPTISTTAEEAAHDVYIFLQLFLSRHSPYAEASFHIAGEGWGGYYIPQIASLIHEKNKELVASPSLGLKTINLESILIGNGLMDPLRQFPTIPDYLCDGPYGTFNTSAPQCEAMRRKATRCERLVKACYNWKSPLICGPVETYCWTLLNDVITAKKNRYDIRESCNYKKDGNPACYDEIPWMEKWMNTPAVKLALGVDPERKFQACNYEVNFTLKGRGAGAYNSTLLLPNLINDGVRLLVYAGDADAMCNYMGVKQVVLGIKSSFTDDFTHAEPRPWNVTYGAAGPKQAGVVTSAGHGAGNITYVEVYGAGHMVPYDQPEATLDLFNKWIQNVPITG